MLVLFAYTFLEYNYLVCYIQWADILFSMKPLAEKM